MEGWKHKELWSKRGRDFTIEISRHEEATDDSTNRGPHRWCVYAYLYPKHPRFERIETTSISDAGVQGLPLHCGNTFNRWHRGADGSVTAKQFGADYNHLYDDEYTRAATLRASMDVDRDAEALFAVLQSEALAGQVRDVVEE